MIVQQNVAPVTVYLQMSTTNKSFIDMHLYLKDIGIQHNAFFLALYDPDLMGQDPRDPNLSREMKVKMLREISINYWYFIREIIRIPDQGGTVGSGKRYKLHRGNLALNFGFIHNWNMMLELPRQHGKTISACCWYLWVFNFGTTNSEIMFMNKKHDDSKLNLQRVKEIRKALPEWLRMDQQITSDGKKLKERSNVETLQHLFNNNRIVTKPSAASAAKANTLGRGCTMPLQWYDEFAHTPYNTVIYLAATPAYKTASQNAKNNHAPYGILITMTPGDMNSPEGEGAYKMLDSATKFSEKFYDYSEEKLQELFNLNQDSMFMYIRFTYQQLGSGQEYFKEMVKLLNKDWATIRREVMLEWAKVSNNSPFTQQELEEVGRHIQKQPKYQITLNNIYIMNVYRQMPDRRYPPIIGVDVSGGYSRDSSAITVIDSKTTEVIADLNCNYIPIDHLAKCIYELVVSYLPNSIVNIERNGGFGASLLRLLIKTKIKKNLYYEIKDRVMEERSLGTAVVKTTKKVKCYGFDETKRSREQLMEILRDRMDNHKRKFISPIIYDELLTLEVKKNGRIEHADNYHDDQIFSYLMALYVWYSGEHLMERYGLQKGTLYTDDEGIDESFGIEEDYIDITEDINTDNDMVEEQMKYLKSDKTILYSQWEEQQRAQDEMALKQLLSTKIGRKAYARKYSISEEDLNRDNEMIKIPDSVFDQFYSETFAEDMQREDEKLLQDLLNMK